MLNSFWSPAFWLVNRDDQGERVRLETPNSLDALIRDTIMNKKSQLTCLKQIKVNVVSKLDGSVVTPTVLDSKNTSRNTNSSSRTSRNRIPHYFIS